MNLSLERNRCKYAALGAQKAYMQVLFSIIGEFYLPTGEEEELQYSDGEDITA